MDASVPDYGDQLGLYRPIRPAIEGVQALDILEADKRPWIAFLEEQYLGARVACAARDPEIATVLPLTPRMP